MSDYVFTPPAVPSVAVEGEDGRFPVRRIFCVGRNYAAHAREMGPGASTSTVKSAPGIEFMHKPFGRKIREVLDW